MEVALRIDSFHANYGECRLLNEQRSKKIFIAVRHSDDRYVAIKVERISNKRRTGAAGKYNGIERNDLEQEHVVYRNLHGRGVPHVHWFGRVDGWKAMVMDLTGPALEELFIFCKRRFSLRTVLMLADQMLDRIQSLHDAGYIHRDLSSDTFVMGIEKNIAKVYLVTMKLTSKYMKVSGGCRKHIPYEENITLCHGLPTQFATVLNYCRALKFEEKPNYLFIRQLFRDLFNSLTYKENWDFDWMLRYCSKRL